MTLCLLGRAAITDGNHLQQLRLRPKAIALLAWLALAHGPQLRSEVAGVLFSDADDPRRSLRWHLNHLRGALPEALRPCLRIGTEWLSFGGRTDVAAFADAARRIADSPSDPGAADVLAMYRGDLMADVTVSATPAFETWLYVEQERLRRDFGAAARSYARWAIETDRAERALEPLARLVTVDPYLGDGWVLLIQAYQAAGNLERAAAAYRRYKDLLSHELHADPPSELVAQFESVQVHSRTLPAEHLIGLGDVTLHAVVWPGDDPPILAIHGSTMSGYSLSALAERLSPDYQVVAVDLRGHGFSDKPPTGYSLARQAADVVELVSALGLRRPVLLGFSLGGAVATLACVGGSASGLVLLDSVVGERAFTENAAARSQVLGGIYNQRFGGFHDYLLRWRHGQYSLEGERLLECMIRYELAPLTDGRYRRRGVLAAFQETWRSAAEVDTLGALARVTCPVFIVHARRPWLNELPYLSDQTIAAQIATAQNATLYRAEESDHPRLVRDPEAGMVAALKDFLAQLRHRPNQKRGMSPPQNGAGT